MSRENRPRVDVLIKNQDGTFTIVEAKLTNTTRKTTGQKTMQQYITNGGSKVVVRSSNKRLRLSKNETITVTNYKVVVKYNK